MVRRVRKSRRVCNKESLRNCKDLRACNKPMTSQTIYKNHCKDRINPVGTACNEEFLRDLNLRWDLSLTNMVALDIDTYVSYVM